MTGVFAISGVWRLLLEDADNDSEERGSLNGVGNWARTLGKVDS